MIKQTYTAVLTAKQYKALRTLVIRAQNNRDTDSNMRRPLQTALADLVAMFAKELP